MNRKKDDYRCPWSVLRLFKAAILIVLTIACEREDAGKSGTADFELSSSEIGIDSLLPAKYTCDGESATLPLAWENAPSGTVTYTLIMHHVASPTDVHWYWILYNIPAGIGSLSENVSGIGSMGTNSVNGRNEYAPPCSQGPGIKAYTFTLYALHKELKITADPGDIDLNFILNEIGGKVITSASMTVYYSRDFK